MRKPKSALPLPPYVRRKWLSGSRAWAYFFEPPTWARKSGCPVSAEALGADYRDAIIRVETTLLPAFRSWQTAGASDLVPAGNAPGSFDWMAAEFRASPKYADLTPRGRRDHDYMLKAVSDYRLKDGRRFGSVMLKKINEGVVDLLYDKRQSHDGVVSACLERGEAPSSRARPSRQPLREHGAQALQANHAGSLL